MTPETPCEVPQAAIEAAAKVRYEADSAGVGWETAGEFTADVFRKRSAPALEAAAPFIRDQTIKEVGEALLSEEAVKAAAKECWPLWVAMKPEQQARAIGLARATITAAIASLSESGSER